MTKKKTIKKEVKTTEEVVLEKAPEVKQEVKLEPKQDKNEWGKLAGQCSEKGITVQGDESVETLKTMLNA